MKNHVAYCSETPLFLDVSLLWDHQHIKAHISCRGATMRVEHPVAGLAAAALVHRRRVPRAILAHILGHPGRPAPVAQCTAAAEGEASGTTRPDCTLHPLPAGCSVNPEGIGLHSAAATRCSGFRAGHGAAPAPFHHLLLPASRCGTWVQPGSCWHIT